LLPQLPFAAVIAVSSIAAVINAWQHSQSADAAAADKQGSTTAVKLLHLKNAGQADLRQAE
jgi:hypothetical protein